MGECDQGSRRGGRAARRSGDADKVDKSAYALISVHILVDTRTCCDEREQLWALTWREAQTQTYADAFLAMAACFVVATAMAPLMRKVVLPKAPTADAH
jgi:hypothetical protein